MTAPSHLSETTKSWWSKVVTEYEVSPHNQRLLTMAAEAWDRTAQARAAIAQHGLTFLDPHRGPRMRPEVIIERDSRAAFARLLKQLNLDEEPVPDPVPGVRSHKRKSA